MAKIKVAINGFGRIGRIFFRAAQDQLDIVGINDLCDSATSAHLLKYDSTHGVFPAEVSSDAESIIVDGKKIRYTQIRDPQELPWKELGVDLVLECTGVFTAMDKAELHLKAGLTSIIVTHNEAMAGRCDRVFRLAPLRKSPEDVREV